MRFVLRVLRGSACNSWIRIWSSKHQRLNPQSVRILKTRLPKNTGEMKDAQLAQIFSPLRRLIPLAAEPVDDEADFLRAELLLFAEGGHAVVAGAEEAFVAGIAE